MYSDIVFNSQWKEYRVIQHVGLKTRLIWYVENSPLRVIVDLDLQSDYKTQSLAAHLAWAGRCLARYMK
jgi:hypothetical protein